MERMLYESVDRERRLQGALSMGTLKEKRRYMFGARKEEVVLRIPKDLTSTSGSYVLIGDPDYPPLLYDLASPPLLLYYEGQKELLEGYTVGVVGARKVSGYGRKITAMISAMLAKEQFTLISGGARGVDGIVHQESLNHQGGCVCVLGCGLDVAYPKEHEKLFSAIKEKGLLLSEYPMGFQPEKWTFPMRNRLIAALSREIVVTEASSKSGSLHTATYGEEMNRLLHAVPHEAELPLHQGTNELIEMGAQILYNSRDFLRDISFRQRLYEEAYEARTGKKVLYRQKEEGSRRR